MNKRLLTMIACLSLAASLCGCQANTQASATKAAATFSQMDVAADVILSDDGITISGDGVREEDGNLLITSGGTYQITGTLTNGNIVVQAPGEQVNVTLCGVSITNETGSALLIESAREAIITLEEDSINTLKDGGKSDYDAALYGVVSYTITGDGVLNLEGTNKEGMACEQDIIINGGNIRIQSKDDGINASQDGVSHIIINDGTILVNAGGDGIDSNHMLTINGGTVVAYGSVSDANGGLDAEEQPLLAGGEIFASGENISEPQSTSQPTLLTRLNQRQAAGSTVSIWEGETELCSFTVDQTYQTILYSSPKLVDGVSVFTWTVCWSKQ